MEEHFGDYQPLSHMMGINQWGARNKPTIWDLCAHVHIDII